MELVALPDYTDLSLKDKVILWKFRYSLIEDKNAMTKVLLSLDWSKEKEEQEMLKLLNEWA
jgi:phosphatidylinositol 3-kinase